MLLSPEWTNTAPYVYNNHRLSDVLLDLILINEHMR